MLMQLHLPSKRISSSYRKRLSQTSQMISSNQENTWSRFCKNCQSASLFRCIGLEPRSEWPKSCSSFGKRTKCKPSTLGRHQTNWQGNTAVSWSSLWKTPKLRFPMVLVLIGFQLILTISEGGCWVYWASSLETYHVDLPSISWTDQVLRTVKLETVSKRHQSHKSCSSRTSLFLTWRDLSRTRRTW